MSLAFRFQVFLCALCIGCHFLCARQINHLQQHVYINSTLNLADKPDFYIDDRSNLSHIYENEIHAELAAKSVAHNSPSVVASSSSSSSSASPLSSSQLHRKSRALRTHSKKYAESSNIHDQRFPILSDNEDYNRVLLNDGSGDDDSDLNAGVGGGGEDDRFLTTITPISVTARQDYFTTTQSTRIPECQPNQFRCQNGQCVALTLRCNNRYDCTDGTDEDYCPQCAYHQFRCGDGTCIADSQRCDGRPDCRDNSDESGCRTQICTAYEFRCTDGTCIDSRLRCNNRRDCIDGSDEDLCQCTNDEFRCENGQCVQHTLRCDLKYDCRDGTDEFNCYEATCNPNQYRCRSGQCISESLRCNGKFECADNTDENDCDIECNLQQFRCANGQCIDARLRCDLKYDCSDGSDETDCSVRRCNEKQFECAYGKCVDISKKCDQIRDCDDGSDEENCQIDLCSITEFECTVDGKCISETLRCDGYYDCHDFSDEQNCDTRICRLSQFRCGTGLCIDRQYICDGIGHCPDRLDEMHCWLCQSGQYICSNGQCIEMHQRCDGRPDCTDYSDETDCLSSEVNIQVYPERQNIRQGQEVVFRCRDESERRLPVKWSRTDNRPLPTGSTDVRGRLTIPDIQPDQSGVYICAADIDNLSNPPKGAQKAAFLTVQPSLSYENLIYYLPQNDNTYEDFPIQPIVIPTPKPKPTPDPLRPPGTCTKNEATCQNGECIQREYVCDGDFDCADRSDELNCVRHCEPNQFQCDNGRCVLKIWRCDSDNDCEDNSDEKFCEPEQPGSPCRYDEYKCLSGTQCIPKSYQCDGEFDCQDKTDEIGCSPPTIVQPPVETISVTEGETVTISCRAVGTPTPLISWRLNWNHIPLPPRVTTASADGSGSVTIREVKPSDQGAWSCEAINSKDSVLAAHDALLVVKPKDAICLPPTFNDIAQNPSDCLRCFCFGVADTCHSSSLRVVPLPLRSKLSIVPLVRETNGSYTDVSRRYPPNQNAIKFSAVTWEHTIGGEVAASGTPDGVYLYWSLPSEFLGNKLLSYGGYLRYTLRYREPYSPRAPQIADLIIRGNGITLYHFVKSGYNSRGDTHVKARLWEGQWHKNELNARSEIPPLFDGTTREDILIALQNLEFVYIKATYDEQLIDTTVLNLELDTAVLTNVSTSEQAVYVEKCACPEGYLGTSCEECAVGFTRQSIGRYLGRCEIPSVPCNCYGHSSDCDDRTGYCANCQHNTEGNNCERCKRGYYGDATYGGENSCRPCPCPHIQPSTQLTKLWPAGFPNEWYSPSCYLDPQDGDITCDACPLGYEGRRCERCAPGYDGNPLEGQACEPRGGCNSGQFRCGNGTCIDIRLRCNHRYDCFPEGSDESGCACAANKFRCAEGGCIDIDQLCDGEPNCYDNSDETNCDGLDTHCDPIGSLTASPSPSTRLCQCKPLVTGARCDQCRANSFHLSEQSPNGCIDCFCFGITKSCTSSNKILDRVELQFLNAQNSIRLSSLDGARVIDQNIRVDPRNQEIVYRDFAYQPKLTYYWSLPSEFLGNKITSYGGRLNYTIRYDRGSVASGNDDPDVRITGNGNSIFYKHNRPFVGGVPNVVSIPLFENVWLLSNGQRATREKLMLTLADINSLLIKATYSSDSASASLKEASLDIAIDRQDSDTKALTVELCRCPVGYQGSSCEECIVGYTRVAVGPHLGLCEPCFCNGHSSDCDPKTGICKNCQHNTRGDFCEECQSGYVGDASRGSPYDCRPTYETPCQCDTRGSTSRECDFNQQCLCKQYVRGVNCDQCADGYFNIDARNPYGCSQCYCSGVTRRCSSSSYFRDQIALRLQNLVPNLDEHNFRLTNRFKSRSFSDGIFLNPSQNEISYHFTRADSDIEDTNVQTLFWSLPEIFLGNKLTSYGGWFRYTQQYTVADGGQPYTDADVELFGNGITLSYINSKSLSAGETQTYDIELKEGVWQRIDSTRSSPPLLAVREDFLRVLSNVEEFLIRASFNSRMQSTSLRDIVLDTAIPQNTGLSLALDVEQCVCPPGYIGLSCEECASGYIRDTTSPGYSRCTRCNCNSHSETCDPNTGYCVQCRHNTIGDSCEYCSDGYYGDATRGTPDDCKRCPCPLTISSNSFSPTCRYDSDGQPTCNACAAGYAGRNCERCAYGYRGNPQQPGSRCELTSITGPTIRVRIDEPSVQRVPVGATVTFRCTGVSQVSDVTYNLVWTKESGSLPTRSTEASGILTIPDVRPEYSGVYICTGSDLQSVAQERATLVVETGDQPAVPRVRIEPYYQEVNVGESVEFRCIAEGYPPPKLNWTGGRNEILNPQSTFVNGVFRIQSARKSDEAEYWCHASNSAGTDSIRTILFIKGEERPDIGDKPHVTVSPVNAESRRGETVRFECQVTGNPLPDVKWSFSGGALPEDSRQIGSLLVLSHVTESHQGLYTCTARNIHGSSQAQSRLSIESSRAIPTAKVEPERQTIVQGQSGELRCVTSGNPIPTITWQKVGGELDPSRHKANGDTLIIDSAVPEDRGLYVCRADNREGSSQSSGIVEIERREIPAIELYPESSIVVSRGQSALFQCRVTAGVPSPITEWRRSDGSPFTASTEILDNAVIRFTRVTSDEEGTYVCTAENIAGRVTAQAALRIQGAPVARIIQTNPYRIRPNDKLRLECVAEGDPKPNVVWRRHQQPFTALSGPPQPQEKEGVAILEIPRISPADAGTYVCSCTSPLGTTEERIQVLVEDESGQDFVVPEIVVEDRVVTVVAGSRAEMRCFVRGTERPVELRWTRLGNLSMPAQSGVDNGVLQIYDVKPEDSGEYQCLGYINGETQLFQARTRLAVVAPPRIQLHPPRQSARPGDTVVVDCIASGDQPITIDWSRIGATLPSSANTQSGRLDFRGIQLSDAGRYLCTAVNAAGKAEGVAEVIVDDDDAGFKDVLRKEEIAFVGSNIELSCQFAGSPPPTVRWTKDGDDLPENSREINNQLWIRSIRLDNAGRYICTAFSRLGPISRDFVVLNVREPIVECDSNQFRCKDGTCISKRLQCDKNYDCPDYSDESDCAAIPTLDVRVIASKDMIYLGDQLTLQCQVTGDPSARIDWTRLGQEGPFPDNVIIRGAILVVNGVKPENGGVYRCSADTYAGSYNSDYVLSIQVLPTYSPEIVETRTAPFGTTVVMDCRTTLDPPITYTWTKQGESLPSDATTTDDGVITIPNIRGQDSGTYICTAKTNYVTIDIPTVLVVTGVVPHFSQYPLSYMTMPTLPDAYLAFSVEISFRPENPNGLILYNGQQRSAGDFISLGLRDGYVEFRYELGSGVVTLRSERPVEIKKWHTVKFSRNKKDGVLQVDDETEMTGSATGRFLGLDLLEPLYIGGVPDFSIISKQAGFDRGFVGCISVFKVGNVLHELVKDAESTAVSSCETCAANPCDHNGVCQEAALSAFGYRCICPSGFSGQDCEKIGDSCYQGVCGEGRCVNKPGGGFQCFCPFGKIGVRCEKEIVILEPALADDAYVAYPTPKDTLRKMNLNMKVKPKSLDDGLLMYSAQSYDGQGDFTSLAIRNGSIEFRFDTGSGPAVLRSVEKLYLDQWVTIAADRDLRHGSLIVGSSPPVTGESPGHTRGLNLRLPLYVGGYDKQQVTISPLADITHGFHGCVGHIEVNSIEVDLVNSVVDASNVADCGSVSPCQRSPCLNSGVCRETGLNEFECTCTENFSGKVCERENGICEISKPCRNGAFCENSDTTAFKCHCSLGFKGDLCGEREEFINPEAIKLSGDGFLTFGSDYLPHTSSLADEMIKFTVLTDEDDGLIFFQGQGPDNSVAGKDFLAVAMVDGKVELSFELGSGTAVIRSSAKVNDGLHHDVVVKRRGKDGSLEIDGKFKTFGESSGGLQMLNTVGDIYIGGLPNYSLMTGDRYIHGFVGCISDLEIANSGVINMMTSAKSARNVLSCDAELISSGAIS